MTKLIKDELAADPASTKISALAHDERYLKFLEVVDSRVSTFNPGMVASIAKNLVTQSLVAPALLENESFVRVLGMAFA